MIAGSRSRAASSCAPTASTATRPRPRRTSSVDMSADTRRPEGAVYGPRRVQDARDDVVAARGAGAAGGRRGAGRGGGGAAAGPAGAAGRDRDELARGAPRRVDAAR